MPTRTDVEDFLDQKHVAFVGASRDPKQFANSVYRLLREGGREMYPVHADPQVPAVEGDPAYRSLADVPDPVDGVVVMVPVAGVDDVVRDALARGIPRVWLYRGAGKGSVTTSAVEMCRQGGVRVVDGACPFMFLEPRGLHRLHAMVSAKRIAPLGAAAR